MAFHRLNAALKNANTTIDFGGATYHLNPSIPEPETVGLAVDPTNGNEIGIYANPGVAVEYLKSALATPNVTYELTSLAWASEYMASSVSLLVDGLEFGIMLTCDA